MSELFYLDEKLFYLDEKWHIDKDHFVLLIVEGLNCLSKKNIMHITECKGCGD